MVLKSSTLQILMLEHFDSCRCTMAFLSLVVTLPEYCCCIRMDFQVIREKYEVALITSFTMYIEKKMYLCMHWNLCFFEISLCCSIFYFLLLINIVNSRVISIIKSVEVILKPGNKQWSLQLHLRDCIYCLLVIKNKIY